VATLFSRKLTISDFDEDLALIGAVKAKAEGGGAILHR
jgi:hypothetical protein